MTTDTDKSRAFYSALLGWTTEDTGPEYGGYINFLKDGRPIAGCMKNDDPGKPEIWTIYLQADDAKAVTNAATENGGQVFVDAMDVMDLGTMAVLVDPGGAGVGVWQPGQHQGFQEYAEVNTPGWFELHTHDFEASVRFYEKVFKWKTNVAGDTDEFRYTTLGKDENALAGIMDARSFRPEGQPAEWFVYFRVANTDDALAKIAELGGTTVDPAQDTPYGRLATAADSTGARFRLMS
jgi:predicted enzyme related to lactoylglutathione lyase